MPRKAKIIDDKISEPKKKKNLMNTIIKDITVVDNEDIILRLPISNTQINNTEAESTNAFIAICRITDKQPDLPNFKRIGYQVIFESDDAFFEYFLMEYYTGNSVTDSLGHWKDSGDSIVQSVNTLEGNPGKLTQPDGFAAAVEKAFPKNQTELRSYEAIRNDLSTLIGLTLNVVTPDSTDRTDYL